MRVNREHKMERVIFSGGYLRSLPEEKPETILRPAPEGAQGMIFGKREINGLEWAKVATRDGVTGWPRQLPFDLLRERRLRLGCGLCGAACHQ